jgi:hypothetical protein
MSPPVNDDEAAPRPPTPASPHTRSGRALTIALGTMFLIVLALLARGPRRPPRVPAGPSAPTTQASEPRPPSEERLERAIAGLRGLPELDDEHAKEMLSAIASAGPSDAGMLLTDGASPPTLGSSAPRAVRFAVVVVRYRGAQLAPQDAPARKDAFARALELRELAKKDFAAAVRLGDAGSSLDIGTVRKGDLEPGIEYELFTLPKGELSEVIDAPRGFWIMRRLE